MHFLATKYENSIIGWNAMIGYDGKNKKYVKKNGHVAQKCILFFCDPFLDVWVKNIKC